MDVEALYISRTLMCLYVIVFAAKFTRNLNFCVMDDETRNEVERERERKNLIQFDSNELLCSECNARDENYFFIKIQND